MFILSSGTLIKYDIGLVHQSASPFWTCGMYPLPRRFCGSMIDFFCANSWDFGAQIGDSRHQRNREQKFRIVKWTMREQWKRTRFAALVNIFSARSGHCFSPGLELFAPVLSNKTLDSFPKNRIFFFLTRKSTIRYRNGQTRAG